ncbi:MAG: 2-C-methyl-D-erythritol 2,4-cyclodiphosphate synthase [Clostridia bacterium]|nr:2-C-methyl-D-erythritol 2,4-cyclodiphosphate synthase [Clostridia bacterium]
MHKTSVSVIIAAAGMSRRMGNTSSKQLLKINSKSVIEYSLEAFSSSELVSEIIIVTKAEDIPKTTAIASRYPKVKSIVLGGAERYDSVRNAFAEVSGDVDIVAIHDAARPLVTTEFINKLFNECVEYGAVCPVGRVTDTVKKSENGTTVDDTIDRSLLFTAQTPQVFKRDLYEKALSLLKDSTIKFTDDASMVEALGERVHILINPNPNIKITHESDVGLAKLYLSDGGQMKIGHGYDVHKLVENRALILGGVNIPHTHGLLGHSDADVLVHAIMDAIIGALGLGDIGKHFPDTDEKYKGISSILLLKHVKGLLDEKGYGIGNVDATLIAQKPKLAPFIDEMKQNIAEALGCPVDAINVKATTEEGLGFTGDLSGISAHAVAIIQ